MNAKGFVDNIVNLFDTRLTFVILVLNMQDMNTLISALKNNGRWTLVTIENNEFVVEIRCRYHQYCSIRKNLQKNYRDFKTVTHMGRISGVVSDWKSGK